MSRKIFFPLNGGVKQGKVEYILHLLLVFSLSDSDVSFVLFCSLESAMMTRLSSSRLVRKSTKLFWHTVWTEVVRSAS